MRVVNQATLGVYLDLIFMIMEVTHRLAHVKRNSFKPSSCKDLKGSNQSELPYFEVVTSDSGLQLSSNFLVTHYLRNS